MDSPTDRSTDHLRVVNSFADTQTLITTTGCRVLGWLSIFIVVCAGCNTSTQQHNTLGTQAFNQGQYSVAINEFQQALVADPSDSDAYYNMAASYYTIGKKENNQQWIGQAEQLYRQSISLNDKNAAAHRGLAALLIETNREQSAFELINTWKTRYPQSTEPSIELARLYQEYGDNRRAADQLSDALRIDPNSVRALTAMGSLRETQGQPRLALDNYMRVLQIDKQQTAVATRVAALQTQLAQQPNGGSYAQLPNTPPTGNPSTYGAASPYQAP